MSSSHGYLSVSEKGLLIKNSLTTGKRFWSGHDDHNRWKNGKAVTMECS
jgi:hypothetical protein